MVPFRTIALGQQRLRASLTRTAEHAERFGYGFLLHVRKERMRQTLGVITLAGESLPLTARLLAALADLPLILAGQTHVTLGFLDQGDLSEPERALDTIVMQVAPDGAPSDSGAADDDEMLAGVEALVCSQTLLQPLVLLLPARPVGWPR